jgi:hypothetical protein
MNAARWFMRREDYQPEQTPVISPFRHLDDYESYNPRMLAFVKKYAGKTAVEIRADATWRKAAAAKPKHFDHMTPAEKANFKVILDCKFKLVPAIVGKTSR